MPPKRITLRIPKEERKPKPRAGVQPSRVHRDRKRVYRRKPKHPGRDGSD